MKLISSEANTQMQTILQILQGMTNTEAISVIYYLVRLLRIEIIAKGATKSDANLKIIETLDQLDVLYGKLSTGSEKPN